MAYVILEDEKSGSESAYFEFDPSNGAALDGIERLLASRKAINGSDVEQISEIADASMHAPACDCRNVPGVAPPLRFMINLLFRHRSGRPNHHCRCRNGRSGRRLPGGFEVKNIVLAP